MPYLRSPLSYTPSQMVLLVLTLVSAGAFAFYGFETLFKDSPRSEYERYGIARLRVFVGSMQLLGACGVVVGLRVAPIGALAAGGLALMMMLGLLVRYRIHDQPRLMVPAATLATVNGLLVALHIF